MGGIGRLHHQPRPPARHEPQVLADKAYSSKANRQLLRRRHISAVIPEPDDQIGHRQRRGSRGGRPVGFDRDQYKGRNVVERSFNQFKQWRGLATRYDKLALTYRGGLNPVGGVRALGTRTALGRAWVRARPATMMTACLSLPWWLELPGGLEAPQLREDMSSAQAVSHRRHASAQIRQCSCISACSPHSSPQALHALWQASSTERVMLAS